jgi:hypothetical protein
MQEATVELSKFRTDIKTGKEDKSILYNLELRNIHLRGSKMVDRVQNQKS